MFEPIPLYAAGAYAATAGDEPAPLKARIKQACGESKRRIDRTTQLALLGACDCARGIELPENTGVYLSSVYGSLSNSRDILYAMVHHGEAPSPFKFINAVGSTTGFYLSQHFGLHGNGISLAQADFAVQSCIELAGADLQTGQIEAALMGVTGEAGYPLEVHRRRLGIDRDRPILEGSYWLLAARELPGAAPIARITDAGEFNNHERLLDRLAARYADKSLLLACGSQVSEALRQRLGETLPRSRPADRAPDAPFYEYPAAVMIHDFLHAGTPAADTLVYIDADTDERRHALVIEKA